MVKRTAQAQADETALSRSRIVETAIQLLDEGGETGLTFRALSGRLSTGAGAIYWHVANKRELLIAASDVIVAGALDTGANRSDPAVALRALAMNVFDAMQTHPWVGAALTHAPGALPMTRIFDRIGQQVRALGMAGEREWTMTAAFCHYLLGVGSQNAANAAMARERGVERTRALGGVAETWAALDDKAFPFAASASRQLVAHDDREDFLTGINLLVAGMGALAKPRLPASST